jgi:hypothetical protein
MFQVPENNVKRDEGPGMTEVTFATHCRAADIHPNPIGCDGLKRFFLSCK